MQSTGRRRCLNSVRYQQCTRAFTNGALRRCSSLAQGSRGGWPLEELRVFEKVVNCFDGEDADECELEGIGQTGAEESEVDWTSMSLADEDIPDG